ncbi:hypothetical protein PspLS_04340 [Pyricularia sp. CBS 133598]|nr:hypothetical protein PspLS_04340 [Pyricularia sp. CBS 133598]
MSFAIGSYCNTVLPLKVLTSRISHDQPSDYPPASHTKSNSENGLWTDVASLVDSRQLSPDHNTLQQHRYQETQLELSQAHGHWRQPAPWSLHPPLKAFRASQMVPFSITCGSRDQSIKGTENV